MDQFTHDRAPAIGSARSGLAERGRERAALTTRELTLERFARGSEREPTLAAIARQGAALDQLLPDELFERVIQGLFRHVERREQIDDAKLGRASDEEQDAVMYATQTELSEPRIRLGDHRAECEVKQRQRLICTQLEWLEQLAQGGTRLHGPAPAANAPP